jgi:membrane-bound lytic murein transglycosylase A
MKRAMRPLVAGRLRVFLLAGLVGLAASPMVALAEGDGPIVFPDTQYEPLDWADLDGWTSDDHAAAFAAFLESCRTSQNRRRQPRELAAIPAALKDICEEARQAIPLDEEGARKFFEDHFRPIRISKLGDSDGFLTGYYEPIIAGSRVPTGQFTAPLYRRPPNLVPAGRRKLGDAFPSKGVFVGRRVGRRKIVPYYDRGRIEDGALDGWHLEICYLHDQVDVLFAQIQGSARIRLEDGTILRVNYDSHNGWPYTPVGRVLLDQKLMNKDQISMQSIRDWMEANPEQAKEVRRQNKSYVFFRITDLATEDEAVGGQGVRLMPGRSIAIDRALHAYGTPFFIQAELPIANQKTGTKFDRLMIAQDTGSAIVGPARADIYFGAGDEAARIAGRIKNPGTFVMLLPRELDPVAAGSDQPLPPTRPSMFGFDLGNMTDPTAPDSDEVPAAETNPAVAQPATASSQNGTAAAAANTKPNARRAR